MNSMKAVKRIVALTGLLLVAWATPPWAADEQPTVKRMMGENFQVINEVLVGLVTANYQGMPEKMEKIREHADYLKKNVPDSVDENGSRLFSLYASNLEYKSANLITVFNELIAHDMKRAESQQLNVDYMRAVAATQFGDIVSTCVLCHNQFRRKVIK